MSTVETSLTQSKVFETLHITCATGERHLPTCKRAETHITNDANNNARIEHRFTGDEGTSLNQNCIQKRNPRGYNFTTSTAREPQQQSNVRRRAKISCLVQH
jgi:hypothetical protein